ncbi:MAG: terminase TerL endonuclease subunit [Gallionellaceae bacterium]|jgi:phage terminase large subunit-like protein
MSEKDFAAIATQYARDVVEGRQIACKWVRLACQRHLNDLARAEAGWIYQFNPKLEDNKGKTYRPAQRICEFAERMPHIKGAWAGRGEKIKLQPWQVFIFACVFGWITTATKTRRFRVVDLFVPRKNSKSTVAAVIGLYMLAADGEFGAEVYSGATSKDQALEVFRPARLMAISTPEYRSYYGVVPNISNLAIIDTNSKFEPVIGKPGDGASPSCWIVDEYHEHKTAEMYETGETGMLARAQPILLTITTAGSSIGGPCYQHQVELQKVLEGTIPDEQRFGIIYTVDDPEKEWATELGLRKANPNWGISINTEIVLGNLAKALSDPRKQSTFKTKHLNIWTNARDPWLNLENLQACADDTLTLDSFKGEECCLGLDLASKKDIASEVYEFSRMVGGKRHYYAISRNYLPESAVQEPENAHYRGWVEQGYIIETPGSMTDLELIQENILEAAGKVSIREAAKDQHNSAQLGANLEKEGLTVLDVPQISKYLSDPMKDIAALVDAGRFHHDGNPAFVWMLSNVECKEDANENIFPRKSSEENKIDAATALIIAHSRMMLEAEEQDASPEIIIL